MVRKIAAINFGSDEKGRYSRLNVRPSTARLVRAVSAEANLSLDELMDEMLRLFIATRFPQWVIVDEEVADDSASGADERSRKGRRTGPATSRRRRGGATDR